MSEHNDLGGSFTLPGTNLKLKRMGYGAMQLAGPGVFGPPRDEVEAIAVLRKVVELGINHIDTSDFYGPHVTNQIIKKALHPYKKDLVIVSKVACRRGPDGAWIRALERKDLIDAIDDNLRNLGLEAIDVINLRVGGFAEPVEESIAEPLSVLAELKKSGKIKHIGLSNITPKQLKEGQSIVDIVCVQNNYNIALRTDDAFIDQLAAEKIAYVPFFPLGGFSPLQSKQLDEVAASINATSMQVALAWLLHRSPNMLHIPGTSSLAHLHENVKAADLVLSDDVLKRLDGIKSSAAPIAH